MKRILSSLLLLSSISLYAQTNSVGTIEGVFNVSGLGAATYTIPVKVPDGVAGMQPGLSLVYSSQGGNGIMGMGWSLSGGTSAISRIPNTIYNDKKVTGVSLSAEDRFALDGQRLIATNGTYGIPNSLYRTEVESFKEVRAIGTLASGPMSFEVTDMNSGRKFYYGTNTSSRPTVAGKTEPYIWLLDKVVDLNGNYMDYTYQYSQGDEPRIASISYTGNVNTGAAARSMISFLYESKPDANFSYLAGGKILQGQRLKSIVVQQMDAVNTLKTVHSYDLQYIQDQYSHLATIIEKGHELNGAPEVLNPSQMLYHNATAVAEMTIDANIGGWKESQIITGDFNGDGFTDIIRHANHVQTGTMYNTAFHLYHNDGNGGFNWAQNGAFISVPWTSGDAIEYTDILRWMNKKETQRSSSSNTPFDYNGDGYEDVIYRQDFEGEYSYTNITGLDQEAKTRQAYSVYASNGTTIGNGRAIRPSLNKTFYETRPFIGDFDGDGKNDVLLLNTLQNTTSSNNYIIGEQYITSTADTTAEGQFIDLAKPLPGMPFDAAYVKDDKTKLLVVDYNGDGKSDILSIWRDEIAGVNHAQVFEMNVSYDADNKPVIGNPVFKLVSDDGYPTLYHEIYPGDFNGDRVTDILTWIDGYGWEMGYGKGNGSMTDVHVMSHMNLPNSRPKVYYPYVGNHHEGSRPVIVTDFNGDGKSDIFDLRMSIIPFGNSTMPEATGPARILYSKGGNYFQEESLNNLALDKLGWEDVDYKIGDFNGDGQAEFYVDNPHQKAAFPGENVDDHWYAHVFRFHAYESRHMLATIINGLGSATHVGYQSLPVLSKQGAYSPSVTGYAYPFIKKTIPIKVVSNLRHDPGGNTNPLIQSSNDKVTLFNYQGFKYHVHGKGVMGFDKVIIQDNNKNITEEKTFVLNTTYAFPWLKSTILKQGQQLLSESNSVQTVYHYGNKRIFPYATQTNSTDYVKNTYVKQAYNYTMPSQNLSLVSSMDIGKPMAISTYSGGVVSTMQMFTFPAKLQTVGGAITQVPAWLYSKPKAVQTTANRIAPSQPGYMRKQEFTYSPSSGLLISTISDPGASYAQTTTNTYDQYGNVVQKTVSAGGMSPRTEIFQYDLTNRFLIKSFNPDYPELQTNTTYNVVTGTVSEIKQADGFIKSFTYDGFNRVKTTADNNGASATTVNIWASGNAYAPTNAKYAVQTSGNTSGSSFTFYDRLGRVLRTANPGLNGEMVFVDQQYDSKGQLINRTDPYVQGSTTQSNTFTYDNLGRLIYQSTPSGNNTSFAYAITSTGAMTNATNAAGQSKKTYTNFMGEVTKTEDEGGVLEYSYLSSGKVKATTLNGLTVQQYEYDAYGRNTKRTDPNYGSYEYTYDNFDQLLSMKDPKGQIYNYTYNSLGKMTTKSGPEGTYTYIYGNTAGPNIGKMTQLIGPNSVTHNYDYGIGNKVNYEERIIGSEVFKTQFQYDNKGRLAFKAFPNNIALAYFYNTNTGGLQSIGRPFATYNTPNGNQVAYLYSIISENAFGQTTKAGYQSQFMSGPVGTLPFTFISNTLYNNYGILTGQNTYKQSTNSAPAQTINNYSYDFQPSTGNLLQRKDLKYSLREDFTYDNVNRLISIQGQTYGQYPQTFATQTMNYAQNGNVTQKTDAGTFAYDQANRISEINPYVNIPTITQNITYTPFDKVATIDEVPNKAQFTYWADQGRAKMELLENNVLKKTKYYAPDFEKEIDAATGQVRELCYIYGADENLVSIIEKKNGVEKTYFVQTDYLGSITQIFDGNGNIVEEKSFDAWGRSRNPQTWTALLPTGMSNGWDRGYTGEEHITQFGIVNLNGRLYDPLMGRMMEPDPLIIGNNNSQGYNRYSYALNNPLKYTDPDGNHPIVAAIAIGAAVSAAMYAYSVGVSDGGFNNWSWRGFAGSVVIGAASGAATYGIGSAFGALSTAGVSPYLVEAGRALAHGTSSAVFSMAGNGGDWDWSSFAAGAGGSLASFGASKVAVLNTHVGSLGVSMAVGGLSSSLTGGKFLEGAVTAGLVHELNFQLHDDGTKGRRVGPFSTDEDLISEASSTSSTPWMEKAAGELGTKEIAGPQANLRIIEYHSTTGGFKSDEIPWCSSFANWTMKAVGINGTNSAVALSWKSWGNQLSRPAYGSIAVISYGGGKGHVGFVAGKSSTGRIVLLGGNQSDMVKYSSFPPLSIKYYVYPKGYTPGYNLPLLNINSNSSYRSTR